MAGLAELHVQLDEFEGSLSLLLQIVEREQLEVTRVSVAAVADGFLALVSHAPEADLSTIGEFVAMAARLLVIKSRALLRVPAEAPEEGLESDDADALARQIAEYRRYQQAATWIGERWAAHLLALPRPPSRAVAPDPRPIAVDPRSLHRAATRLLAPPPIGIRDEEWPQVDYQDVRHALIEALSVARSRTFAQVCGDAWHPLVVITLFLALLDTVSARVVRAEQREPFGAIILSPVVGCLDGTE
jgi:segregation and condensation protein A